MTAYQRRVIDREASRMCAQANRVSGHPAPSAVWPLLHWTRRWVFRRMVADALGLSLTLADWPVTGEQA